VTDLFMFIFFMIFTTLTELLNKCEFGDYKFLPVEVLVDLIFCFLYRKYREAIWQLYLWHSLSPVYINCIACWLSCSL